MKKRKSNKAKSYFIIGLVIVGSFFFVVLFLLRFGFILSPKYSQYHYPNENNYYDEGNVGCEGEIGPSCSTRKDIKTSDSINAVLSFYRADLTKKGWKEDKNVINEQPYYGLQFTKTVFWTNYSLIIWYDPSNQDLHNEILIDVTNEK